MGIVSVIATVAPFLTHSYPRRGGKCGAESVDK